MNRDSCKLHFLKLSIKNMQWFKILNLHVVILKHIKTLQKLVLKAKSAGIYNENILHMYNEKLQVTILAHFLVQIKILLYYPKSHSKC